ncbi:hypothetical protein WKW80_00900 [Variovorax humicola]|uniref:Secreted protein n=1 Tax=Variovorax humicola TaxID=1769758 RepID=A0ABU8VSB2_9BURK
MILFAGIRLVVTLSARKAQNAPQQLVGCAAIQASSKHCWRWFSSIDFHMPGSLFDLAVNVEMLVDGCHADTFADQQCNVTLRR